MICFGNAIVFLCWLDSFSINSQAIFVKRTHSQAVFQLTFAFISRVSMGFWFLGRVSWLVSVWCGFLQGVFSNRLDLKSRISRAYNQIILNVIGLLKFRSIKCFDLQTYACNFVNSNLHWFQKPFRDFLKIVYCYRNIFISRNINSKRLTIIIFILSANWYLNKTQVTSSKAIYKASDLIELINASWLMLIVYNLPEYFTFSDSIRILLRIVLCVFDKVI